MKPSYLFSVVNVTVNEAERLWSSYLKYIMDMIPIEHSLYIPLEKMHEKEELSITDIENFQINADKEELKNLYEYLKSEIDKIIFTKEDVKHIIKRKAIFQNDRLKLITKGESIDSYLYMSDEELKNYITLYKETFFLLLYDFFFPSSMKQNKLLLGNVLQIIQSPYGVIEGKTKFIEYYSLKDFFGYTKNEEIDEIRDFILNWRNENGRFELFFTNPKEFFKWIEMEGENIYFPFGLYSYLYTDDEINEIIDSMSLLFKKNLKNSFKF